MATDSGRAPPAWRRIAWFVGIYVASVLAVGAVVYGLKAVFAGLFG
jgi:Protein of unknown function (DUF2474)